MGHSTGGMVAPNVALKSHVAFIVSLAGAPVPGAELVPLQLEAMARAQGAPEILVRDQVEQQKRVGAAVVQGEDAARKVFAEILPPLLTQTLGHAPSADELKAGIDAKIKETFNPWTNSFMKLDPRVAWKQLKLPVLLVVGEKDTQVPADMTIATLKASVGDPSLLTTNKLPGLNHLFQKATTGLSDEYPTIEDSIDPAALDVIAAWLKTTAKIPG
jgi:pimeloyl-ACP methyl ester carboxylesterase